MRGNPLQYSYLENPMDRGAWQATVHRVSNSRTWLTQLSPHIHLLVQQRVRVRESKVKCKSLSRVWLFATPWTIQSMKFSRPEYWSGKTFLSPGELPNPGIKPRSPALQADSLPAEPQGKPKKTGVVAYPFSRGSSRPRNWTGVFCIAGGFFTNWAIREAHNHI